MPLITRTIDASAVGADVQIVAQSGYVMESIAIVQIPANCVMEIGIGSNPRFPVTSPLGISGLDANQSQDSREGLVVRITTPAIGTVVVVVAVHVHDGTTIVPTA